MGRCWTSKERFQSSRIVGKAVLLQLALFRQHGDLRDPFVEIDAHVYHRLDA
jgi:hypothetical protein